MCNLLLPGVLYPKQVEQKSLLFPRTHSQSFTGVHLTMTSVVKVCSHVTDFSPFY